MLGIKEWIAKMSKTVLVGEIKPYAGSNEPTGWLKCDGRAISRTEYSALFNVIGTTYGTGDGSTTFNLPDMRNRFPVGAGDSYALNAKGGANTVTLTADQMPSHRHGGIYARYSYSGGSGVGLVGYNGTGFVAQYTDYQGRGQAHENRPPYIGLNFLIYGGYCLTVLRAFSRLIGRWWEYAEHKETTRQNPTGHIVTDRGDNYEVGGIHSNKDFRGVDKRTGQRENHGKDVSSLVHDSLRYQCRLRSKLFCRNNTSRLSPSNPNNEQRLLRSEHNSGRLQSERHSNGEKRFSELIQYIWRVLHKCLLHAGIITISERGWVTC